MTIRTTRICDACGRDIESVGRAYWEVVSPMSLIPTHFHDLKCLGEFVQRELGKPKVVPFRGITLQHEEPKK